MGLAIAKLLFLSPAAATNAAAASADWMYALQRATVMSESERGRSSPRFGVWTHDNARGRPVGRPCDRASPSPLSRLPACLGPPVVVNGRYANVHYGLRFLFSSFSSFVVSLIQAQATCPFVVLLDNLYSV